MKKGDLRKQKLKIKSSYLSFFENHRETMRPKGIQIAPTPVPGASTKKGIFKSEILDLIFAWVSIQRDLHCKPPQKKKRHILNPNY